MAQIRVEALDKSFGAFHAVKAASFTVEDGQFLCLLGPSGCGKTTTLRMIAGLELPTAGTIRLGGDDVTMNRASASHRPQAKMLPDGRAARRARHRNAGGDDS